MTKLKLGNSENYIDVSIIYKVKEALEKTEVFVVTDELLETYEIPVKKFVTFLQQQLNFDDPHYALCHELWSANKGIYSKTCVKDNSNFEINKVSQIITEYTGIIDLETK